MDRQVLNAWMIEEKVYAAVVGSVGAHFTTLKYTYKGNDYEVLVENDDFELLDDLYDSTEWDDE